MLGIYASKPADTTVYCLLGGGACLVPKDAGTADHFIAQWLISHPTATVIPVSSETQTIPNSTKPASPAKHREVFVWIADGDDVLNAALVREGYYTGKSMIDMVESEQLQIERAKKIAAESPGGGFPDLMAKWRESTPKEDHPRRLVSDSDYALRMKEITSAEHDAQLAKRCIYIVNTQWYPSFQWTGSSKTVVRRLNGMKRRLRRARRLLRRGGDCLRRLAVCSSRRESK